MSNNEDVSNSLICAVREGRLDRVRELISEFDLSYSTAWSGGYALLLEAVHNKHTRITKLLLSYGSPVNSKDNGKHSNTPLHFAVRDGDMEVVQMLIGKGANIDAKDECGRSPLHIAIEYNEMEIMELLFNRGASVYDGNPDGIAPLHIAAEKGYVQIVERLLKRGAYVDSAYSKKDGTTPTDGYTPLCVAVENGNEEIIKLLVGYGADVNSKAKDGIAPLHIAAEKGYLQIVERLLKHGAYVDPAYSKRDGITPRDAYTPLCFAVYNGNEEIIRLLLNQGANIDVRAKNGSSPLHIAAKREHIRIVELLLKHGAYIDFTIRFGPKKGYTPLCFAIKKGKIEIIKLLVRHGADINTKAKDGVSPLHIAIQKGDLSIVEHLLQNVANVNSGYTSQRRNGYTPLHHAIEKGSEEIVKLLLSKGAKVDSKGNDGITPLHIAAERGYIQIAERLLKEGAYVDSVYENIKYGGYTPLCFAVKNRHEKVVQLLLENGANVDSEDVQGNTILYFAVKDSKPVNLLIVQHLFKYGPDINHQGNRKAFKIAICKCEKEVAEIFLQFDFIVEPEKSYDYHKMLYAAVENGYLRIVEQFLNKREEIAKLSKTHAKDENENTARISTTNPPQKLNPALLTLAVKKEHKEIVELLLQHGADINAIDKCGRTALHFTSINEDQCNLTNTDVKGDIAKLLLSWGADVNARNGIFTTLHIAVENEYVKVVEALLEHNADVNSAPKFGITPLHISAKTGNKVISKMLLNKGANVNAKQHNSMTALHLASYKGHIEVVEVLLRCGAKVNSESSSEVTPLHIAAQRGFLNVVNILLKFGADIDSRDAYGRTALQVTSREGYKLVVIDLLKHGADINIKSEEGLLPIDYAEGFDEVDNAYEIDYDSDDDFDDNPYYPRQIIIDTLNHHIVKLKAANLYVNEENLMSVSPSKEINDIQCKCNEEIARMKSEKINNANVSFFDILTKGTSRIALYAENEDIVRVLGSDDYQVKFPIYANIIENNFRKGKIRKRLLKEGNKFINFFFNNFHELPYTCKRKIFSYLSDNDLKILTHTTFERRKALLEQGYRFFHFLFISFPDFPYECTEKIFSYLSDEDLKILVEACKPANVGLQY